MTTAPEAPCVCVIDDDPDVRGSLGSLLRANGYEVRLYEGTAAFKHAGRPSAPACLVLDIRLSGEDGLEFHERMKADGMVLPVVFITGHGDIPMTVRGMRGGAIDFLPKPFEEDQLLAAVEAALEVDRTRIAATGEIERLGACFNQLTVREREVMSLVVTGLMNKQVAGRLGLSEITVKIHRGSVMRKMEAQSFADLVRMAELLGVRDHAVHRYGEKPQPE